MSGDDENELTSEDKRILKYVADAAREEMPSRRGFIQGGTAAAALGALGFGTGQATAQAQTQPAGQVGTDSNPADLTAAVLSGSYPSRVRAISGGQVVASIDPSSSTTPIQDAIDAVNNDGNQKGKIWVPDGTETPGGLSGFSKMSIEGYSPETIISHTDDTQPTMVVTNERECELHNLVFDGPGSSAGQVAAIRFDDHVPQFDMGHIRFRGYNAGNSGVIDCSNFSPWVSRWGYLRFADCDGRAVNVLDSRPLNQIGMVETYMNTASRIFNISGGHWQMGGINVGGSADVALHSTAGSSSSVECGWINFEPTGSIGGNRIAMLGNDGRRVLGHVRNNQSVGSTDGVTLYESGGNNGNVSILSPIEDTEDTLNNPVDILNQPTKESWYYGPAADINNSAGSSTGLVRSMATAGTGNG